MKKTTVMWLGWLALFATLCAAAVVDPRGWRQYVKLRGEVRRLEEQNRSAARDNERLSREARALKENPAAIERAVRQELGFIRPGEIVLQLRPNAAVGPVAAAAR